MQKLQEIKVDTHFLSKRPHGLGSQFHQLFEPIVASTSYTHYPILSSAPLLVVCNFGLRKLLAKVRR